MDEMAEGILRYFSDHKSDLPVVVRLCGTMEEEGSRMMTGAGYSVYDDLRTAASDAVRFAAEGE